MRHLVHSIYSIHEHPPQTWVLTVHIEPEVIAENSLHSKFRRATTEKIKFAIEINSTLHVAHTLIENDYDVLRFHSITSAHQNTLCMLEHFNDIVQVKLIFQ